MLYRVVCLAQSAVQWSPMPLNLKDETICALAKSSRQTEMQCSPLLQVVGGWSSWRYWLWCLNELGTRAWKLLRRPQSTVGKQRFAAGGKRYITY